MNYFKTKLIIIHFIVIITFHDVYGTEDEISPTQSRIYGEQRPSEHMNPDDQKYEDVFIRLSNEDYKFDGTYQTTFRTQPTHTTGICIEILDAAEVRRNENYLEYYLDIFNILNTNYGDFSLYDEFYTDAIKNCLDESISIFHNKNSESDIEAQKVSAVNTPKTEDVKEVEKLFDPLGLFQDTKNNHDDLDSVKREDFDPLKDNKNNHDNVKHEHFDPFKDNKNKNDSVKHEHFDQFKDNKNNHDTKSGALSTVNTREIGSKIATMFFCDIVLTVYDIFRLPNAFEYCNVIENNPYYNEEDQGVNKCENELKSIEFIFKHGIDNYALSITFQPEVEMYVDDDDTEPGIDKIKSDILYPESEQSFGTLKLPVKIHQNLEDQEQIEDETVDGNSTHTGRIKIPPMQEKPKERKTVILPIEEALTELQKQYIAYLKKEVANITENDKYQNFTKVWCMCVECEKDLHDNGFKNRRDGKVNHQVLKSKYGEYCDNIKSEATRYYCDYLKNYGEDPTVNLLGTFKWCMTTIA